LSCASSFYQALRQAILLVYVCIYVCTDDVINNRLEILNKGSGWFIGVVYWCSLLV